MKVLSKVVIVIGSTDFAKFRPRYHVWAMAILIAPPYLPPCFGFPMDFSHAF